MWLTITAWKKNDKLFFPMFIAVDSFFITGIGMFISTELHASEFTESIFLYAVLINIVVLLVISLIVTNKAVQKNLIPQKFLFLIKQARVALIIVVVAIIVLVVLIVLFPKGR
jgi:uncharacterized membrane protein